MEYVIIDATAAPPPMPRQPARRVAKPVRRRPRVNMRGDVWCNHCERYLLTLRFRRHPSQDRWWSYCIDCTRELDRMRWTGERRDRSNQQRIGNQRQQAGRERYGRIEFVAGAILILRKRGLTKSEIARLGGFSLQGVLKWERRERLCDPGVADRFVVLLCETAHLPNGSVPCYRRQLPHPEYDALMARCASQVAAIPVRTKWGQRA